MVTFNNMKELEKYVGSKGAQNSLLNQTNVKKVLIQESRRLERYLKEELQKYYNSYSPSQYERTGDTVNSIQVTAPRKVGVNGWDISITFDEGLANHDSYIGSDQPKGYTPWLLHTGWDLGNKLGYVAENFTRFKGTNYVTKAVERFNKDNKYGLTINVYHGNQDVTDNTYSYGK